MPAHLISFAAFETCPLSFSFSFVKYDTVPTVLKSLLILIDITLPLERSHFVETAYSILESFKGLTVLQTSCFCFMELLTRKW